MLEVPEGLLGLRGPVKVVHPLEKLKDGKRSLPSLEMKLPRAARHPERRWTSLRR